MLRWLLILAMALLPWHGWAGTSLDAALPQAALAAAAGQHGHADSSHAPDAHAQRGADHAAASVSADCVGQGDHATAHVGDGCPGCSMCHSCTPLGLVPSLAVPAPGAYGRSRPAAVPALFASAERARWLKPPIS